MRILIFHGYLLRGTGSNVYNASLARALVGLGHEVHLLCQDRGAGELPFVDAVGDWRGGTLDVRVRREPVRCTAYLPDIGNTLPVYVRDRCEGFTAVPFPELGSEAIECYITANERAVRDVVRRAAPDVALANHLVMGPAVLARALGGTVPYAVKVHGSALEYSVRPHPDRFLGYAREGLERAEAVLVGSRHTAESLWEVVDEPSLPGRTRLGPPGVDVEAFAPRPPREVATRLSALADRLAAAGTAAWGGSDDAAAALSALDPERGPIVAFVGKLIVSKGVDLLIAAWPLVAARVPGAQLCVVGFGTYREGLERLRDSLAAGDVAAAREVAAAGRELEGGPPGELRCLAAFLDRLEAPDAEPDRDAYLASARVALREAVHLTGRLEHTDLPELLPAASAQVVPSTFPEAFGMVAAEAACCGALPVSAAHSGLAEVSAALAPALDPELRPLLSFELGAGAVEQIADRLAAWLTLRPAARERASAALAELARGRFGWESVARGVIAAAEGRLADLAPADGTDSPGEAPPGPEGGTG